MDQTQDKQTYEVFSKLQFVTLKKNIKAMQLLYIAIITNKYSQTEGISFYKPFNGINTI